MPFREKHPVSYYAINGITLYRVIASIILFALIFLRQQDIFKWMLAISFFTDAIDGWLARKFKVASAFGSRMDSLGDDLTVFAGTVGLFFFKQEFLKQYYPYFILLLVLFLVQFAVAMRRYGKTTSFHTYLAKLAAILQGCFLILIFFTPEPFMPLFYSAVFVTMIELLEEIVLVLMLPKWKRDVRGIYWVIKNRD